MNKIYYVYVVEDREGIQYVGVRGHKDPYNDTYMGSYTSTTYNPVKKVIIALFLSKEEAYKYEIHLHEKYNVGVSASFANKAKAHSTKFNVEGLPKTEAQIQSAIEVGKQYGKVNFLGKHHTAKTKALMSKKAKERPRQPHKQSTKNKLSVKRKGINNPFYGRTHTEATKAKQRAASIGNKHNADNITYIFIHKSGDEFVGTRQEFKDNFNYPKTCDCIFSSTGTTYTYKGWRLSCLLRENHYQNHY